MEAIISISDRLGETRKDILRFGFPSDDFRKAYPECCETGNLREEIEHIQATLAGIQALLKKMDSIRSEEGTLAGILQKKTRASEQLKITVERASKAKDQVQEVEEAVAPWRSRLDATREETAKDDALLSAMFVWESYLSRKGRELRRTLRALRVATVAIQREIASLTLKSQDAYRRLAEAQEAMERARTEEESYSKAVSECEEGLYRIRREAGAFSQGKMEERSRELTEEGSKLQCFLRQVGERLQSRAVIGMTLDAYVSFGGSEKGIRADWVFVDEAAYAPIVKALPIFASQVPRSFFGDHRQLPPVCEADSGDDVVQSYWGKPCLFIEEAYASPSDCRRIWEATEPSFRALRKSVLKETYRFGDQLARVLDIHVYDGVGLRSASSDMQQTRIVAWQVTAHGTGEKRVNIGEVDAILKILMSLEVPENEDIAVITPYKNQLKIIRQALRANPALNYIEALNTHQTQGREWDTVIFSAVDGSLPNCRPYFTDSREPDGRAVINTTLSRVKKKLILVVEDGYWISRKGQLLGDLVHIAEPISALISGFDNGR